MNGPLYCGQKKTLLNSLLGISNLTLITFYISLDGERVFATLADNHKCTTLMTKRLLAGLQKTPIQELETK